MRELTFFLVFLSVEAFAQVNAGIEQAKTLLTQGRRREAVELLDKTKTKARKKYEHEALTGKRKLFLRQFLTADSFEKYQRAKMYLSSDRWIDCLKEIEAIQPGDQDNKLILVLKAECETDANLPERAEKTLGIIWQEEPDDVEAALQLATLYFDRKKSENSLQVLSKINPVLSEHVERTVILRSKLYVAAEKYSEAIMVLRDDQEKNIDHIGVIYELADAYMKKPGNDWLARKYFALFVTRCKRMKPDELKRRKLEKEYLKAQEMLTALEQKLSA